MLEKELSDIYKENKEAARVKKLSNLEFSTKLLTDNGINFESKNGGIHLIINHNNIIADFWPSTGKFQIRGKGYSRGVRGLLKGLGVKS